MIQKKIVLMILASALVVSLPAAAEHKDKHSRNAHRYTDTARVIEVDPVYRTVRISRPERECWDEDRTVEHLHGGGDKTMGGIIGGILGGVAGHQVGKGRGKTAATIIGTIIGSKVGSDFADNGDEYVERHTETKMNCRTVNNYAEEERLTGYQVTYRYHGRTYETFMKRRPGRRIDVRVNVVPVIN